MKNTKNFVDLYFYNKLSYTITKNQKNLVLNLSKKYLSKNIQIQITNELKKTKITD